MDQDRQSRWQRTILQSLWTVGIVVALVVAISIVLGYQREWEWTGLVKDKAYTKRTLWDWLQLLIIPAVLAGVGLWFNRQQREQESQTADRRAQDEALQAYLDQMGQMLLNEARPLRQAKGADEIRMLARARTLSVLTRVDGEHKSTVLQFLYESGLINRDRAVVQLRATELGAENGADLRRANLRGAYLRGADLREVNLQDADLRGVNLRGADLFASDLRGADLSAGFVQPTANPRLPLVSPVADLRGANLLRVMLQGANLSDADLSYAKGISSNEELEQQARSLERATMPNGQKYEDWLKDKKAQGKDVKNE